MGGGRWEMGDGRWEMGDGRGMEIEMEMEMGWKMGNGEWERWDWVEGPSCMRKMEDGVFNWGFGDTHRVTGADQVAVE